MDKVVSMDLPCSHCGSLRKLVGDEDTLETFARKAIGAECGACGKPIGTIIVPQLSVNL